MGFVKFGLLLVLFGVAGAGSAGVVRFVFCLLVCFFVDFGLATAFTQWLIVVHRLVHLSSLVSALSCFYCFHQV
jgi:hypothetical protein